MLGAVDVALGICSGLIALPIAALAFIFNLAVASGGSLVLIHIAGVALIFLLIVHVLPISWLPTKRHLIIFALASVTAAFLFGLLYYFAEVDDPFRPEGELWANHPFALASVFAVLPPVRAIFRLLVLESSPLSRETAA
jgi:hypothetical protein